MSSRKTAVLLVNLGSPDSPSVRDVRRYLREFLSDPRVLDGSWFIRQFVLNVFILPSRPKESAHAYQTIWQKEGSPLVVISKKVQELLQQKIDLPVYLAMRYGRPSIPDVIQRMIREQVDEILLIPLYPHYAMSSYETVVAKVREVLKAEAPQVALKILAPFYNDPDYVQSLIAVADKELQEGYDHLLFSFHGLPERHLKLEDRSKTHCLVKENCCNTPHPVHDVCYRAQAFATVREFVKRAGIPENKFSVSFQSRLGRDPWLKPYTDLYLEKLAKDGVKKLIIMSPAFVSDCLETLEELGMRGKESFLKAGGKDYRLIPCLNDHPLWIEALKKYVSRLQEQEISPKLKRQGVGALT
jgi:protoporphyrin/coproporphyrin ferrochelatase